jgi:hypothetical protein
MKIQKLKLGRSLTREQQRQIKGGSGVCKTTEAFRCTCTGYSAVCLYGDGVNDTNTLCTNYCETYHHVGGTHTFCNDPACVGP